MATETMSRRCATSTAKLMALMCAEDSKLGKFREGLSPVTRTGDYSGVVVVDADGRIIPWQRVARLDANEMRGTMREIVDKLYTYLLNMESLELTVPSDHRRREMWEWDRPREDPGLKKQMDVLASGVVETGRGLAASPGATESWARLPYGGRGASVRMRACGQTPACGRLAARAGGSTGGGWQSMSVMAAVSNAAGYDALTDSGSSAVLECQRRDEADGSALCPSPGGEADCETGRISGRGKGVSAEEGMMVGREGSGGAMRGDCR